MKKKGIFCISPARINVCGKLKLICFDKENKIIQISKKFGTFHFKQNNSNLSLEFCPTIEFIEEKIICVLQTGTLTEDGLDLKSVLPAVSSEFQGTVEDITKLEDDNVLLWSLASCHSLTIINNQLQGDPLDAKMFEVI